MTIQEWIDFANTNRSRAERVRKMIRDRAESIAKKHGMNLGVIHNASIANVGEGWGAGTDGRARIKAAKHCKRLIEKSFQPCRLADSINQRYMPR